MLPDLSLFFKAQKGSEKYLPEILWVIVFAFLFRLKDSDASKRCD